MFVPITPDSSLHIHKHLSRYLNVPFFLVLEVNDTVTEPEQKE